MGFKPKIFECCICKKQLKNVDTYKITRWSYNTRGLSQFEQDYMKHFCKKCMSKIDNWIKKHSED